MRPLSTSLQNALASSHPRPVVSLDIEDHRRRLYPLGLGTPSSLPHAMTAAGTALIRCCVQCGGLYWAAQPNPTSPDDWPPAWQLAVSDGALEDGDVALAVDADQPGHWLAAYQQASGEIRVVYTENAGLSWSTPMTAATAARGASLALAEDMALYSDGGALYARPCRDDLGQPVTWTAGRGLNADLPAFEAVNGVATCREPGTVSGYLCLACLDGALYAWRYNLASETVSDLTCVLPGSDAQPSRMAQRCWPAICCGAESASATTEIFATVLDTFGDTDLTAWSQTLLLSTSTGRFPQMTPIALPDMPCTSPERVVPAVLQGGEHQGTLILADQARAMTAPPYDAAVNRMGVLVPSCLRVEVDESGSRMEASVPNTRGWQCPEALSACQPLAEVNVYRGLWTAGEAETIALPPHYIVQAEVSADRLRLLAMDGLGLLGLVHPAESLLFENRTVREIAKELCALAGLQVDGDCLALEEILPRSAVAPTHSAGSALAELLGRYGLGARCDSEGIVQVLALEEATSADLSLSEGDLLNWHCAASVPAANTVRVLGGESEGLLWSAGMGAGLNTGLVMPRIEADESLCSEDQVEARAKALWREAQESAGSTKVVMRLHPGLELWDTVSWRSEVHRVSRLVERWNAGKGIWQSELALE